MGSVSHLEAEIFPFLNLGSFGPKMGPKREFPKVNFGGLFWDFYGLWTIEKRYRLFTPFSSQYATTHPSLYIYIMLLSGFLSWASRTTYTFDVINLKIFNKKKLYYCRRIRNIQGKSRDQNLKVSNVQVPDWLHF